MDRNLFMHSDVDRHLWGFFQLFTIDEHTVVKILVHIFWCTMARCATSMFMSSFSIINCIYLSLLSQSLSLLINLIRSLSISLSFSKIQILLC